MMPPGKATAARSQQDHHIHAYCEKKFEHKKLLLHSLFLDIVLHEILCTFTILFYPSSLAVDLVWTKAYSKYPDKKMVSGELFLFCFVF